MAGVTYVSTVNTTSADPWTSASFTPAVGDLIVILGAAVGGATYASQVCTESAGGGTYSPILRQGRVFGYIADQLVGSSPPARTIQVSGTASETGGGFTIWRISGMSRTGAGAVRQSGRGTFVATGVPTVSLGVAADTNNPLLGHANNSTNPAGLTPRASWTERFDNGFATPTTGVEYQDIASGETATNISWGAGSASAGEAIVVELDASVPSSTAQVAHAGAVGI